MMAIQQKTAEQLINRPAGELERDPVFTPDGAVCDEQGSLSDTFYKGLLQAFKDREAAQAENVASPMSTLLRIDPELGQGNTRPGLRPGEQLPRGLRMWDD